jgi:hypothetical protein
MQALDGCCRRHCSWLYLRDGWRRSSGDAQAATRAHAHERPRTHNLNSLGLGGQPERRRRMAWGWTGRRSQPGPNKSPVKSRPFRAPGAQTWTWGTKHADWADPADGARCGRQGHVDGDSQADRDRPSRQQCTVTQASPRHSTTSHLTPAPTTSARRHEGTADQMACHSAGLGHGERGAATASDGLFSCCSPLPCPSHLSIDELTEPGLGTPELAGAYFATVHLSVYSVCRVLRHRLGSR